MAETLRVLGISGSLRKASFNKMALDAAVGLAPAGMTIETYVPHGIAPFNQDEEKSPSPEVVELKRRIRAADAILFCTPEYNYSLPGVLKNAIDCASRPYGDSAWAGKPCAIMGVSVGRLGSARAQYHLRQSLVFLDMPAVLQPEVMIGNAAEHFDEAGKLKDADTAKFITRLLVALAELVRKVRA